MVSVAAVWRWSQLCVALVMVVMEWFLREVFTVFFKIVPLSYCLQILGIASNRGKKFTQEDAEMEMDTCRFIEARGYRSESHFATTPDGYILGLHRIPSERPAPNGADEASNEDMRKRPARGVVLMLHGMMMSSEAVIFRRHSDDSIPLRLAQAGYDVWLGNNRGNKYSCKHVSKRRNTEDYWDFSLDDIIRFDVPTMVEYVLAQTGAESLTLVGFSQGTAQTFGYLTGNDKLVGKVNLFIALAPVSAVNGLKNPIVDTLARSRPDFIFLLFGKKSILPSTLFWRKLLSRSMYANAIDIACRFLFGWDMKCIDASEKDLLYAHLYSYGSVKCVVHWFQIIQNSTFQMFDDSLTSSSGASASPYDCYSFQNMPQYRTMQIKCPVACFIGGRDNLPNSKQVLANLPKDKLVYVHKEEEYEHLDFMWAKDSGTNTIPKILTLLETHNPLCD